MPAHKDGPVSPLFAPVPLKGNIRIDDLAGAPVSKEMKDKLPHVPVGPLTSWGIPFQIGKVLLVRDKPVTVKVDRLKTRWLVFMHACDRKAYEPGQGGIVSPYKGFAHLGNHAADYVIVYADGAELRLPILCRRHVGPFWRPWGENCFEAVGYKEPCPICSDGRDKVELMAWGRQQ